SRTAVFPIPAARFGLPGVAGVAHLGAAELGEQVLDVVVTVIGIPTAQEGLQGHPQLTGEQRITKIGLICTREPLSEPAKLSAITMRDLLVIRLSLHGRAAPAQRMITSLVRPRTPRPHRRRISDCHPPSRKQPPSRYATSANV